MSFCKTHYKARSTTGRFYQKIQFIWMTSQYFMLSPFEWPWPTCASSCGVVSYWACAKATCTVGVSEPIKVIGCILYPPTCTRLKVTAGYREKKRSPSWIIFLLSLQTVTEQKWMNYFLKLCVQRLLLTWSWRCLR